jgi:hypothetical protein
MQENMVGPHGTRFTITGMTDRKLAMNRPMTRTEIPTATDSLSTTETK